MSRLLALVLFAGLTACTSLDSAFDGASNLLGPSSRSESSSQDGESAESAENTGEARAGAAPSGGEAAGQTQAAATPEAEAAQAAADPAAQSAARSAAEPAATSPAAPTESASRETASAQTGEQSGETEEEGGGEAGIDGRRVITVPKGGGGNAEIRRRLDSLFGESHATSSAIETGVKASEVVGVWQLEEEDGLRNCIITLTAPDKGGAVSGGAECSGLAAQVTGWGMFGNDLLLRDADNTVRARLRRSDAGWIGFTLETGIPLVMSRAG